MAVVSRRSSEAKRSTDRLWLRDLTGSHDSVDAQSVGGKASRIAMLHRNGIRVPPSWAITCAAFQSALTTLPPSCEPRSLLRAAQGRSVYTRAAEASREIHDASLPLGLVKEVTELFDRIAPTAPWGLAVRSSATCEDGDLASLAGLCESVLGVSSHDALLEAIRRVWASIADGRSLVYLASRGVNDFAMGVLIQPVIKARAAGVMFTRALDGAPNRIVNSTFGLGTQVVGGRAMPDVFRIDQDGKVLERTLADKSTRTVIESGVLTEKRDPAGRTTSSLDDEELKELARVAAKLETFDDTTWDVEFVAGDDGITLVQARHAAQRGFPKGGSKDTVWTRANVGEALPGPATPFTWSIAGAFSEHGFRQAFGSLGCSVPNKTRLVSSVHGRFYLNLSEFMGIASQVPWLPPKMLLELAGGNQDMEVAHKRATPWRFYSRLPLVALRLVREQLGLDEAVNVFEHEADIKLRGYERMDFTILPDEGVAKALATAQGFLEETGTVMLRCASSALGSHIALRMVLDRFEPGEGERLAHGIVSGIRDLESARPAIGLGRIVELARREPDAAQFIETSTTMMPDDMPTGPTRDAVFSFLKHFGDRGVKEAELSAPRWRDDPRAVLGMLRIALRGGGPTVDDAMRRAENFAEAERSRLFGRVGLSQRTVVRHMVAKAQKSARLRERLRAWVTRVLGVIRRLALVANDRLVKLSPELASVTDPSAVFLLSVEEVTTALRASRRDLTPLVRARLAEFARDRARPEPPVTFKGSPPPVLMPIRNHGALTGLGASSGLVVGRARVLFDAEHIDELQPGEILITPTTDVGWTPLFLTAAGVVTELGGPLSHAAVVARELGVPAVVNVDGVTRLVRNGDMLRIDGDRGTVELLSPESSRS